MKQLVPDPRSVTDTVALASMLLGAGLAWSRGLAVFATIAATPLEARVALAEALVGLPAGADPRALYPLWHTDAGRAVNLLETGGIVQAAEVVAGIAAMNVRDRAHIAAYLIGAPPNRD